MVIKNHRYKPEIYFNFVKHILLSGQNLLNILKLANLNTANDKRIENFSVVFFDSLKRLVSRTKMIQESPKESFETLIQCIENAAELIENIEQLK